jgi:serpin B
MVVFLPEKPGGLPEFEKSFTVEKLMKCLRDLDQQDVSVYVPRFTIKTPSYRIDDALQSLGMTDAFLPGADFSGMASGKGLCIGAVLHKGFVDVTEEGTEAAAATAVVMKRKADLSARPVFRADHPFIFLVLHKNTKCILFLGRLTKPENSL